MDKLTLFALRNNRFTQLLLVLIIIIGSASFLNAPSKEDPETRLLWHSSLACHLSVSNVY